MKSYIYLFAILTLFSLSMVSASIEELPPVKQGECATLPQVEFASSYQNITFIQQPNGAIQDIYQSMTKNGESYSYQYCNTTQIGTYLVNGCSDLTCWSYSFSTTPSGTDGLLGFFIIAFAIAYGIAFIGFFGKNEWVAIFGGLAMIILGVFCINNGIDAFRNAMTDTLSWITIGLGATFALTAGISILNENL